MKWEWKGEPLAPPHTIAIRLLVWPVAQVARCVLCAALAAGWGLYDAKRIWDETA
jgi:hypothetical protein